MLDEDMRLSQLIDGMGEGEGHREGQTFRHGHINSKSYKDCINNFVQGLDRDKGVQRVLMLKALVYVVQDQRREG